MRKTAIHHNRWLRRGAVALGGLSIAAAALAAGLASGGATSAHAQAQSCATAEFSASAESSGTAFVDVGVGKTATFVCIVSEGFTGGQSPVITANGAQAGGCYFVDGLGTSVVSVFKERADIKPECKAITSIKVGTQTAAASPTATTPAATATATPTRTPTQPAATQPAATATPTRAATQPPATATAPVVPRPPATGTGIDSSGGLNTTMIVIVFGVLAAGGLVLAGARAKGR